MRGRLGALMLLVAVAATGCASSQERDRGPPGPPAAQARASKLHVTNRNWLDMRIYALRGSERIALLSITSMRTDSASLPNRLLTGGGFRLLADPVGAEPYRSNTIYLRPGQALWWRLENTLSQSSIWVH